MLRPDKIRMQEHFSLLRTNADTVLIKELQMCKVIPFP